MVILLMIAVSVWRRYGVSAPLAFEDVSASTGPVLSVQEKNRKNSRLFVFRQAARGIRGV
jgi:hypothetical protein